MNTIAAPSTFAPVAAVTRPADVPLDVDGEAIPLAGFAPLTVIGTLLGLAIAGVLRHRARHLRRTFVVTTAAVTVASLVPDSRSTRIPAPRSCSA